VSSAPDATTPLDDEAASVPGPLPDEAAAGDAAAPLTAAGTAEHLLDATCPFLRSVDGTWRSRRPARDHRCWAEAPPAGIASEMQVRLCLSAAHPDCDRYRAAVDRRAAELARDHITPERVAGRFGVGVQPIPLSVEAAPATARVRVIDRPPERRPVLLVAGVAVVALLAIVVLFVATRPNSPSGPAVAVASPSPSVVHTPAPTVAPSQVETPQPTPSPAASTPTPVATPPIARRYKVKAGDTLASIAAKFHVTKAQIRAVNDLARPAVLTVGQVINIPFPAAASPGPS
jgi:LysM domain-containing protein